jgi:pimeloyl-ACP methyl ester carboxylesterase
MARVATVETIRLGNGRALCARRWAGGGDHAVVILHGLLDSSEGWTALCDKLRSRPRIAFDLPGFGYSDPASRGSIRGYAEDVAEGLAALGVGRFTLVGHSLGGAVATALAEMYPDRIGALVLLAPAGFGRIRLAEAVSVPGVRSLVQSTLPLALSSRLAVTAGYATMITNGRMPDRAVVSRVTTRSTILVDGAREGTRAVVDAGRASDAFHRRRVDYDGPVFAVWGKRDRLVPVAHHRGVRTAFPHAEVEIWPGMGHHPLHERFDELRALLTRAITTVDGARPVETAA